MGLTLYIRGIFSLLFLLKVKLQTEKVLESYTKRNKRVRGVLLSDQNFLSKCSHWKVKMASRQCICTSAAELLLLVCNKVFQFISVRGTKIQKRPKQKCFTPNWVKVSKWMLKGVQNEWKLQSRKWIIIVALFGSCALNGESLKQNWIMDQMIHITICEH